MNPHFVLPPADPPEPPWTSILGLSGDESIHRIAANRIQQSNNTNRWKDHKMEAINEAPARGRAIPRTAKVINAD
jgi:hypothetical protein